RDEDRAAPLAADADTLERAQNGEDDGTPHADRTIARQKGYEKGRDAHQHQGRDKGRLAPDAIAEMTEDEGADRARDKADEVDGKRVERRGQRRLVGEEELAENQAGHRAVEQEIVPLERGADSGGDDRAPQLARMIVGRKRRTLLGHRSHWTPPWANVHRRPVCLSGELAYGDTLTKGISRPGRVNG